MNVRTLVAVYIDLENVGGNISVKHLMDALVLGNASESSEESGEVTFAVKAAFGRTESIGSLRRQLTEYNFEIHETPHLGKDNNKNRADLIISISAFEMLYLNNPPIDRYVFVTSDADFTVIMDTLRKYGKEVWLVARKQDLKRRIFNNSCDHILAMEDFYRNEEDKIPSKTKKTKDSKSLKEVRDSTGDTYALVVIAKVLLSQNPDRFFSSASIGNKFHQLDRSFNLKNTRFRGMNAALKELVNQNLIEEDTTKGQHLYVKVKDQKGMEDILGADAEHFA